MSYSKFLKTKKPHLISNAIPFAILMLAINPEVASAGVSIDWNQIFGGVVGGTVPGYQALQKEFVWGICKNVGLVSGSFGAMIASIAGLVGFVSAMAGMYRAALNFVAVAACSFCLGPFVQMFVGDVSCQNGVLLRLPF
jgi:hypothetical protein